VSRRSDRTITWDWLVIRLAASFFLLSATTISTGQSVLRALVVVQTPAAPPPHVQLPSLVPTLYIRPKAAQVRGSYTSDPIAHPALPQFSSPVHYVRAAVVWTRYALHCFLFHHLSIASASYAAPSPSSHTHTTIWTRTLPYRSRTCIWRGTTTLACHQVQTVCMLIRSRLMLPRL
jgi:hypothetical protein